MTTEIEALRAEYKAILAEIHKTFPNWEGLKANLKSAAHHAQSARLSAQFRFYTPEPEPLPEDWVIAAKECLGWAKFFAEN